MDKDKKEQIKTKLVSESDARIEFLNSQIQQLTNEYNVRIQSLQDEIDTLTIKSSALKAYKI